LYLNCTAHFFKTDQIRHSFFPSLIFSHLSFRTKKIKKGRCSLSFDPSLRFLNEKKGRAPFKLPNCCFLEGIVMQQNIFFSPKNAHFYLQLGEKSYEFTLSLYTTHLNQFVASYISLFNN
jgi:hypothetical protein